MFIQAVRALIEEEGRKKEALDGRASSETHRSPVVFVVIPLCRRRCTTILHNTFSWYRRHRASLILNGPSPSELGPIYAYV